MMLMAKRRRQEPGVEITERTPYETFGLEFIITITKRSRSIYRPSIRYTDSFHVTYTMGGDATYIQ